MTTSVPASLPIRTRIEHEGQRYIDRPIYAPLAPELRTVIAQAVREAFRAPAPRPLLLRYETDRLIWKRGP